MNTTSKQLTQGLNSLATLIVSEVDSLDDQIEDLTEYVVQVDRQLYNRLDRIERKLDAALTANRAVTYPYPTVWWSSTTTTPDPADPRIKTWNSETKP